LGGELVVDHQGVDRQAAVADADLREGEWGDGFQHDLGSKRRSPT
jgi:hypothetical protein